MKSWGLASWLDLWFVGVALKAVKLDGSVGVATLTKIGVRRRHAVGGFTGVAIDAGLQAVLAGANATPERVIPLVLEQLHVVAPHKSRVRHALATPRRFNHRLRHPRARRLTRMHSAADQQTKQQC
jgi:hypothetical protein